MPKIVPFCRSFSLLARCFKGITKQWAYYFGLKAVSMHKMCEEPPSDLNPDGSGQRNYLDEAFLSAHCLREELRQEEVYEIARWLAHAHGGFFTPHREFSGILPSDACGLINDLLKNTNSTTEQIRKSVFTDSGKRTFTKVERAALYRTFEDGMGVLLAAREYVRTHKAEENEGR